jgi:hypothetical protein
MMEASENTLKEINAEINQWAGQNPIATETEISQLIRHN